MNLEILFEDDSLLIVDKPAGMVVHEGAGENANLLTDWISRERPAIAEAFKDEPTEEYYRPGIVHRLDKDTSGIIVIAKTPAVKTAMQSLFKEHTVEKIYTTLVYGEPNPAEGRIETTIARNPQRKREMAVSFTEKGKGAKTDYRTLKNYRVKYKGDWHAVSLVSVTLHSGRMHQIRVHMKYKGWPVIGDQTYKTKPSARISAELGLSRQFLHASSIIFTHPVTGEIIAVKSPLPSDLQIVMDKIEGLS
jgi:23S rRNA pseudouridine1911/1915/1917 synthase